MAEKQSEILTHAEIQSLLERNNQHPEIGRPVYIAWSDNRGRCDSQEKLDKWLQKMNVNSRRDQHYVEWVKRLDSKKWKIQMPGKKEAELITRQVRTTKGTWVYVGLNERRH